MSSPGQKLRSLVERETIAVPGAPNALTGRLVERFGFEAVYLSGASLSSSVMAVPDVGLFTLADLARQAGYLTRAVRIPVIVDADTGFGTAADTAHTVRELERVGAAAVQIEDQQSPKRCGHLGGKSLISVEAMCDKLRAAAEARLDADLVIIARTDARGVGGGDGGGDGGGGVVGGGGLDEAIDRAGAYLAAGADWIFPEALADRDEFARFADEVDAPLVANMTEFGKSPLLTLDELAELGYAVVLYPVTLQRVAMKATEAALAMLATEGTQAELLDLMQTRQELYDLLDYEGDATEEAAREENANGAG